MKKLLLSMLQSAITYVVLFSLLGFGSIVTGVALIFGFGPAVLLAGVLFFGAAAFIVKGMKPNG